MKRYFLFGSLICLAIMIVVGGSSHAESGEGSTGFPGTWIETDVWHGCGTEERDTWTIKITQQGDSVTLLNVDRNHIYKGFKKGNKIFLKGISYPSRYGGNTIVDDYELTISEDKNTLEGTMHWKWDLLDCLGESKITCVRKMK